MIELAAFIWILGYAILVSGIWGSDLMKTRAGFLSIALFCLFLWPVVLGLAIGEIWSRTVDVD